MDLQVFLLQITMLSSVTSHYFNGDIARALKVRASQHGISVEAEHRRILEQALTQAKKKSFIEVLGQIPNVGEDSNFVRVQNKTTTDVFD